MRAHEGHGGVWWRKLSHVRTVRSHRDMVSTTGGHRIDHRWANGQRTPPPPAPRCPPGAPHTRADATRTAC
eukprot:4039226-Prymnesium_polylepis.1